MMVKAEAALPLLSRRTLVLVVIGLTGVFFILITRLMRPLPRDETILTQSPCSYHCWYHLVPGESTLDMLHSAVSGIEFIASAVVSEGEYDTRYYFAGFSYPYTSRAGAWFIFRHHILYSIRVRPNLHFTLADLISRFGEPEAFQVDYQTEEAKGRAILQLSLYYPRYGLVADMDLHRGQALPEYPLLPDMRGASFELYPASDSLEQLVAYQYNFDLTQAAHLIQASFRRGWPGGLSRLVNPVQRLAGTPAATPLVITPS